MKIQIDEQEIGEAVQCYLSKQGVNVDSYSLEFNVIAGRSDSGPRVEITMTKLAVAEPIEEAAPVAPFSQQD